MTNDDLTAAARDFDLHVRAIQRLERELAQAEQERDAARATNRKLLEDYHNLSGRFHLTVADNAMLIETIDRCENAPDVGVRLRVWSELLATVKLFHPGKWILAELKAAREVVTQARAIFVDVERIRTLDLSPLHRAIRSYDAAAIPVPPYALVPVEVVPPQPGCAS